MQVPSKRFFKKYLGYDVYLVDGSWLRKHSEEFGDFLDAGVHGESHAMHWLFPSIPKNEIWIADELKPEERTVNIIVAATLIRDLAKGTPIDKAHDRIKCLDGQTRRKMGLVGTKKSKVDVHESVYLVLNGVKICMVDGEKVRDEFDPFFIEGGHGYVYDYVPKDEIWIDNTLDPDEVTLVYLHEYSERHLMKTTGMKYDDAHIEATRLEYLYREGHLTEWLQEWQKVVDNALSLEFLADMIKNA